MSETPFFFPSDGQRLFGMFHERAGADRNALGWVFCHPFAEEKLWAHRVYVNMAREFASQGMPVLRFDYRGYGDSDGLFEQSTLAGQIADVQAAIAVLRARAPQLRHIGLLGLRYGATLALLAAAGNQAVDHLILWDPVISTEQYLQDQLRSNLTTQMVLHGKVVTNRDALVAGIRAGESVNIDGYDLGNPFYDEFCAARPLDAARRYSGRAQIVEIARASQAPRADVLALAEAMPGADRRRVEELQFWKEIKPFVRHAAGLAAAAREWLEVPGA